MRYSSFSLGAINTQAAPTSKPMAMPPEASSTKLSNACAALKVPVTLAAMAKRNSTRPLASFSRLSPSSKVSKRRGSFTRCSTARADTASGGDTMAPSAAQAAHGKDGNSQCATTATTMVVNSTAPMARASTPIMWRCRWRIEMLHAPSINSGGKKMTRMSSESGVKAGKPGTKAIKAPPISNGIAGGSPKRVAR